MILSRDLVLRILAFLVAKAPPEPVQLGPVVCGTAGQSDPGFGGAWTDAGNITDPAATYATWASGSSSHYLVATGFGFNVPSTATVLGVQIDVIRHASANGVADANFDGPTLWLSGEAIGDEQPIAGNWPLADAEVSYGGAEDLWGASLTPAVVNSADWGFAHRAARASVQTALVRVVRATVWYLP